MKTSRHEKAIRAELEAVETELALLTETGKRFEATVAAACERRQLLNRLLDTPAEKGNGEDARDAGEN